MARAVLCQYCREKFERIEGQFEKDSKGFYHKECYTTMIAERASRQDLLDYALEILGKDANIGLVMKQIKDFSEKKRMTESGIKGTLYFLHNVKKMRLDPKFGIAIVAFHYQDARRYFERLEDVSDIPVFKELPLKEITIQEPVNKKRGRITDLEALFKEGEI